MKIIYELQDKYELLNGDFKDKFKILNDFRVVTPVVGKFSTGKSSLLNALLGKSRFNQNYLAVDLTPETAIPTEITYDSTEKILVCEKNGIAQEISLEDYGNKQFKTEQVSKIQLFINNDFLKSIHTVKIVDMPGFDSGVELHNRAIDEYLPESHAYILTFSATEPVIPESIVNFLNELRLYSMPIYIVITKSKSVTDKHLQECVENIGKNASKYLHLNNVEVVCTNAKGRDVDVEPFAKILRQIEKNSEKIFAEEVKKITQIEADRLEKYLTAIIRQVDLRPSEIASRKEECVQTLTKMKEKIAQNKRDFFAQVDSCINTIQSEVGEKLYASASGLEIALMNNSGIKNRINAIVRETMITSMNNEFAPKFRRYVEKMTQCINLNVDTNFEFKVEEKNFAIDTAIQTAIVGVVKKAVPTILGAVGLAVSGPIAAVIGLVTSVFVSSKIEESRRNEQRMQARRKVHNEIIPNVVEQVATSLRQSIYAQIEKVNANIDEEAQKQIQDQEKILDELTKNFELEIQTKNSKLAEMKIDLEIVSKIISTQ